MALKTSFVLEIRTISPLHIGTGRVLLRDFDYVVSGNHTLRIHEERSLARIAERGEDFARLTRGVPPGQILGASLGPGSPLIRYAVLGVPSQAKEIRECVKDAFDRPYLPGSSLKGALRTVLLWHIWGEQRLSLAQVKLGGSPKFAAQPLEQAHLGPTPHADLLRALRLADSEPAQKDCLRVVSVRCVSPAARAGIPLALEAVAPDTVFRVEGHVDETAFRPWGDWEKPGFLPKEKRSWLSWQRLASSARKRALERLERDIRWAKGLGINPGFWEEQRNRVRKDEEQGGLGFPLQVGFGTGWLGTTLGAPLLADRDFEGKVYRRFKLGRTPRTDRQTAVASFPASRRLVRLGDKDYPLGWVWVTPKEVS